ncbi:MAG: hypothetical protein QXR45_10940 [Candidatus Bathyarchaeia archaeon]
MEGRSFNDLLLSAALAAGDKRFDPDVDLLVHEFIPTKGTIHTTVRGGLVHPFRESAEYALYLLESREAERKSRAERILRRVISAQDTDPKSSTYGIWPYFLEEPLSQMKPPDWNWADFIGSTLLIIEIRHGENLPPSLREDIRRAIENAARSIERRNVTTHYTNIAVMGTFVVLATAENFELKDLWTYATNRLKRLAATIDESGSFSEFNSPTYTVNVTITNLTRMLMFIRDEQSRSIIEKIHRRAWLHVVKHWHAPTRQISGPMSRCYVDDLRENSTVQLILQKATKGALKFYEGVNIPQTLGAGMVAVHDYCCPDELIPKFLEAHLIPIQHRELFRMFTVPGSWSPGYQIDWLPVDQPVRVFPQQGTTWLDRFFSLGTCNWSTLWNQSRPLIAYWLRKDYLGKLNPPGCFIRFRFIKDDFDFASANIFTVQDGPHVLAIVNFSFLGGDRHPSLDIIKDGVFEAKCLKATFTLSGAPKDLQVLCNGERVDLPYTFKIGDRLSMDLDGVYLGIIFPGACFGEHPLRGEIKRNENEAECSIILLDRHEPERISWRNIRKAFVAIALTMSSDYNSLEEFDEIYGSWSLLLKEKDPRLHLTWKTPRGKLYLSSLSSIRTFAEHLSFYSALINRRPIPIVRLSGERIFV